MKKCIFTLAILENGEDNESKVLEVKMNTGKLLLPICNIESDNMIQLKNYITFAVDTFFSDKLLESEKQE